jgi:2-keto-4-pentenoate hydratase
MILSNTIRWKKCGVMKSSLMKKCALNILGLFLAVSAIALDQAPFVEQSMTARKVGKGLPQFSLTKPGATLAEAETIQKAYVQKLLATDSLAGFKGAVVGKGGQNSFQIDHPLSAVLFQSGWHAAATLPVIDIRPGATPGIETELGIILAQPIKHELKSINELKSKVKAIVPVIELPAGLHDWPQKPQAIDLVAANVDSDHYIVGEQHTDLALDLDLISIQLFAGEMIINEARGGDAHRGQWWNFLYQVNWAIRQGYGVQPGQLFITGALGKIVKNGAGAYRATYGPLGIIHFSLKD